MVANCELLVCCIRDVDVVGLEGRERKREELVGCPAINEFVESSFSWRFLESLMSSSRYKFFTCSNLQRYIHNSSIQLRILLVFLEPPPAFVAICDPL